MSKCRTMVAMAWAAAAAALPCRMNAPRPAPAGRAGAPPSTNFRYGVSKGPIKLSKCAEQMLRTMATPRPARARAAVPPHERAAARASRSAQARGRHARPNFSALLVPARPWALCSSPSASRHPSHFRPLLSMSPTGTFTSSGSFSITCASQSSWIANTSMYV